MPGINSIALHYHFIDQLSFVFFLGTVTEKFPLFLMAYRCHRALENINRWSFPNPESG